MGSKTERKSRFKVYAPKQIKKRVLFLGSHTRDNICPNAVNLLHSKRKTNLENNLIRCILSFNNQ